MAGPTNLTVDDRGARWLAVWGNDLIEENTIEQAARTARLPVVAQPVALMPDAHVGFGSTVGSVIATNGAVIPSAIGVDIGCGMVAGRTNLTSGDLPDRLGALHGALVAAVPAGLGKWHGDPTVGYGWMGEHPSTEKVLYDEFGLQEKAALQFGTLGSGNHFLEICLDETDRVWVVLHSGSRGVGKCLAEEHIKIAEQVCDADLEDPALAYLQEGSPEFQAYIDAMLWAQDYAAANRQAMILRVLAATIATLERPVVFEETINCHHNYTVPEVHDVDGEGRLVWVTRKGAVRAGLGDRGIIPGSMATGSYIVTGLGNSASWESCSHGAGRTKSRGAARRELTADSLREAMAGKAWNDRSADDLVDEHPLAYKDVAAVMAAQADLVRIDHTLTQVLNVKGTDGGRRRKGGRR